MPAALRIVDAAAPVAIDHDTLTRADVQAEICRQLLPFRNGQAQITGSTVISKDLQIDSLAIMDMVMELEDRFDVTVPLNRVAEIHTVDELTDAIVALRKDR